MFRLYLCRHGETAWNTERRIQGLCDIALSERGTAQAHALACRLGAEGLLAPRLLCSPLQRAQNTARPIAERLNIDVCTEQRLIELDTGCFTAKTMDELQTEPLWQTHLEDPYATGYAQAAESLHQADARVGSMLDDFVRAQGDVIWVTHAGLIRLAMMRLLDIPKKHIYSIAIENAAMTMFRFKGEHFKFCFHNK